MRGGVRPNGGGYDPNPKGEGRNPLQWAVHPPEYFPRRVSLFYYPLYTQIKKNIEKKRSNIVPYAMSPHPQFAYDRPDVCVTTPSWMTICGNLTVSCQITISMSTPSKSLEKIIRRLLWILWTTRMSLKLTKTLLCARKWENCPPHHSPSASRRHYVRQPKPFPPQVKHPNSQIN